MIGWLLAVSAAFAGGFVFGQRQRGRSISEELRETNDREFAQNYAAGKRVSTIALDFDGVIHQDMSPWTTTTEIHDPPVEGAFEFIQQCLNERLKVIIHTARANDPRAEEAIKSWLVRHGLPPECVAQLKVTSHKDSAIVYIDDKGWRFDGVFPSLEGIRSLRPWNRLAGRRRRL